MKIITHFITYIIWIFISILFIICFTSCEEYYDIDIEQEDQKVIVNSVFSNRENIEFNLYKSLPLTTFDINTVETINNAEIWFYENNHLIEKITPGNDLYKSYHIPQQGNTYTTKIVVPGEDTIVAQSYIPQVVDITSVTADFIYEKNTCQCNIRFADPEDVDNYYIFTLQILYQQRDGTYEAYDFGHPWIYAASDFAVIEYNIFPDGQRGLLFSDKLIDGTEYTLNINLWKYYVVGNSPFNRCKMFFCLTSISEDLYLYAKSIVKQNNSTSNPFKEYFNAYSNIENGLGIFGGYSMSIDSLIYRWGE